MVEASMIKILKKISPIPLSLDGGGIGRTSTNAGIGLRRPSAWKTHRIKKVKKMRKKMLNVELVLV
jgi:hypothetical protein